MAAEVGVFVNLRIGPYVCAEWSFGGLPTWLLHVPGIEFRGDNKPWENYMGTFVEGIASITQPYLAKNGGPVILAQIENEYHGSSAYVNWCGQLIKTLNMNVSWVMCNGMSASDTINTCNGNNCYGYAQNHGKNFPQQPLGWTENEGWFNDWTRAYNPDTPNWANRSPQDMAYSVAIWFAAGGAHHNYYMWYGGNHVSWTAGSGIANWYADGVNYHSDGLIHEPKTSHLQKLHNILSDNQYALLETGAQIHHEIPIETPGNGTLKLYITPCNNNDKSQEWSYDSTTGLLSALEYGNAHCVIATGNSDPVQTTTCNANNNAQKWSFIGNEFKSTKNSCLDVFGENGPGIDEWECKPSGGSDSKNQEWTISGTQIKSQLNGECLSAEYGESSAFAYEYHSYTKNSNLTFLCNTGSSLQNVTWKGKQYSLPSQSVSILDNNNIELYNSDKVNTTGKASKRTFKTIYSGASQSFTSWTEQIPLYNNTQNRSDTPTINQSPLEQIRFTNNSYEYLIYETNFTVTNTINTPTISIAGRLAMSYIVYIDNMYIGQAWDGSHSMGNKNFDIKMSSNINGGEHSISIISSSLGIHNGIANQQPASAQDMKGIVGTVKIGTMDITKNNWSHYIGKTGERLNVASSGINKIIWKSPADTTKATTWYKTTFNTPNDVNDNTGSILLDIGANGAGFKRGHYWFNGRDMGHYNNVILSNMMVQQYYFIPNDYFTPNKGVNTIIFADELPNVNPSKINIVFSTMVVP
eukprot:340099_1